MISQLGKEKIENLVSIGYINLGFVNGWGNNYPTQYLKCVDLNCKVDVMDITPGRPGRNCRDLMWCKSCKIMYQLDSS